MVIVALILALLMLVVFWYDATRFIIPNWLVGLVLALYPIYFLLTPAPIDWLWSLSIAGIAFAIGILLFATRIMGGGDVKLLAACCLWVGKPAILNYVILTALLGGALSIILLSGRPVLGYLWLRIFKKGELPQFLEKGGPAPYGLAIAGAMLILLIQGKITGIERLI